jgi:hypothetical protein
MQPQTITHASGTPSVSDRSEAVDFVLARPEIPRFGFRKESRAGSDGDLELQPLLRRRLLYAAVLTGSAFTLYTLTLVVERVTNRAAVSNRGTSLVLSASFTALLVASAIVLAKLKSLPIALMRVIELAGVGCLIIWDVQTTLGDMARATPELVHAGMAYANSSILPWFMHICVYAALIPNSARRAAQVVGGMALIGAGT